MAVGRIEMSAEIQGLRELRDKLGRVLTNAKKAVVMEEALKKAIVPVVEALKRTTPLGPTGNLRAAIGSKVVPYPASGNAVGLVGFRRAGTDRSAAAVVGGTVQVGNDRGFHQYWLEEGTQVRFVGAPTVAKPYKRPGFTRRAFQRAGYTMTRKGKTFPVRAHTISGHSVSAHDVKDVTGAFYYASSFRELGPFKMVRNSAGKVQTDPAYPKAFFKKSRNPIQIPPMPAGGTNRSPPLKTAFELTQPAVAEILSRELRVALTEILSGLTTSTSGLGTIE